MAKKLSIFIHETLTKQHYETQVDPTHSIVIAETLQGGSWTIKPLISLILFKCSACVVKLSSQTLWNVITSSQGCVVGVSLGSSKIKLVIEFFALIRLLSYHEWSSELLHHVKLSEASECILSRCYTFAAFRLKIIWKGERRGYSRRLVLCGKAISRGCWSFREIGILLRF